MKTVFIAGATGYMGKRLSKALLQKGHRVISLVRKGSEHKVVDGSETVIADPFDPSSFHGQIPANAVYVQLLGVSHPSPRKADLFQKIDLKSVKASADAGELAGVAHFIYVSVSMAPSRLMAAYQVVRKEGEEYCRCKQLNCTFIRPWYVLGPGHYWPVLLLPIYGIAELVPSWKQKARAMALVSIRQMIRTLVVAVEADPPSSFRIVEIAGIRRGRMSD